MVEIRSQAEVRATLDGAEQLDGIPFMPEMVKFCGRRYRVEGRLEKVFFEGRGFLGSLSDTLKLEGVRCDGSAHAGCQMGCLLLWKEAWLKSAAGEPSPIPVTCLPLIDSPPSNDCSTFRCQATELVHAVKRYAPWALWRYPREYLLGERTLVQVLKIVGLMGINKLRLLLRLPLHGATRGQLMKTPEVSLSLQPGDWVRVKSKDEIRATLDAKGRNRGMRFTPDMVRYCGGTFRVAKQLERTVIDFTARMHEFQNTVVLENVHCSGIPLGGCGRRCYHFWREAWLEKVDPPGGSSS